MARHGRTLARVLSGTADAAIRFADVRRLLLRLGFRERVSGSHHVLGKSGIFEAITLTNLGGYVPAYQVRRVRHILQTYGLAEAADV